MTLYPGERTLILHTALDEDDVALTAELVETVFVTVYNGTYTEVLVAETAMTWRSAALRWEYSWATAGVAAGTYRARVRILGLDGASVWEYERLRLAKDPVAA